MKNADSSSAAKVAVRLAGVALAMLAGIGLEAASVAVDRLEVQDAKTRIDLSCADIAGDGLATVELYRARTLDGNWRFATNGTLGRESSSRAFELAREPLTTTDFFAVLLFADADGDGLSDSYERYVTRSDPRLADTDGDGLLDGAEHAVGSDLRCADTDGDGIGDSDEVAFGSDPCLGDSDGDGVDDYVEIYEWGTSPVSADTDGDGMPDEWECRWGLDPLDAMMYGGDGDWDGDGLSNLMEFEAGTDPTSSDTDMDGCPDFDEVLIYFTDPCDPDMDQDGLLDGTEIYMSNSDPTLSDTDGDGLTDYDEYEVYGTDPTDALGDVDGDGLLDVWEVFYGYDPIWTNESDWDDDGDGLTTLQEYEAGTDPKNADTDGDGFDDWWEAAYCKRLNPESEIPEVFERYFDPTNFDERVEMVDDLDGDWLSDVEECTLRTNPFSDDTDGDGLPDAWEHFSGLDPLDASGDMGAEGDPDGDWLTNMREYELQTESLFSDSDDDGCPDGMEVMMFYTNPRDPDMDNDGLPDGVELFESFSDPMLVDSDGDGIDDYDEFYGYGTDPASADTDGDGLFDGDEIFVHQTDPFDPDTDGDGMPDKWELDGELDPLDAADAELDADGDELLNYLEYECGTDPCVRDTDGDGFSDGWEYSHGSDPLTDDSEGDFDSDGLTNSQELRMGTDPVNCDTDYDGLYDGWECKYGFNPFVDNTMNDLVDDDMEADPDEDGLPNAEEARRDTNPFAADSDGDGLSDGEEITTYRTNPLMADTDGDGFSDGEEATYGFDPRVDDSEGDFDGDGISNTLERTLKTDPFKVDTDGDGLPDGWELDNDLSPLSTFGPDGYLGDPDEDGLSNSQELGLGTDPQNPDTDADGLSDARELEVETDPLLPDTDADGVLDGVEVDVYDSNPLIKDTDGDGLEDGEEIGRYGTDPCAADTDSDGLPDDWELEQGFNPRSAADAEADPDFDGLSTLREYEIGTDPLKADTDGDFIQDGEEVGWVELGASLPEFDLSGSPNLLKPSRSYYYNEQLTVELPFVVKPGKLFARGVGISMCGVVAFFDPDQLKYGPSVIHLNRDLLNTKVGMYQANVAAYMDDLFVSDDSGASIRVADINANGRRWFVVEYADIGLYNRSGDAATRATFQVAVSEYDPHTVYVRYVSLSGGFDGSSATIGAQGPAGVPTMSFAFEKTGSVSNGMVIAYHFGTGSDPLAADTDGDGLNDVDEEVIGTNPTLPDTDGDGLDDFTEEKVYYSNPLSVDTDGDGLDDGWEVRYELDLWDANDAFIDSDGDGLTNDREFALGTNPTVSDTDGDGLSDSDEIGWIELEAQLPAFDLTDAPNLLNPSSNYDGNQFVVEMPFAVKLGKNFSRCARVCLDGVIAFPDLGYEEDGFTPGSRNRDLAEYVCGTHRSVVAPYWDDLYVLANSGAAIRAQDVSIDGQRWFVIEYARMGLYDLRLDLATRATFQVALSEDDPHTVYVRYLSLGGGFDGSSATLGTQGPDGIPNLPFAFEKTGIVSNGTVVAYHFGIGSDPLKIDSDDDGLDDMSEFLCGTNPMQADTDDDGLDDMAEIKTYMTDPLSADTDGDGMNDGWEAQYGFDPLDGSDAAGDADEDGLSNARECELGTDPLNPDTDGDGLSDLDEAGWIEIGATIPVFNLSSAPNLLDSSVNYDGEQFAVDLPFMVKLGGEWSRRAKVCIDGIIGFHDQTQENYAFTPGSWNWDFSTYEVDNRYCVVAPYWDDLYVLANSGAAIRAADARIGDDRWFVIEYANIRIRENRNDEATQATFQVAVRENDPYTVYVRYVSLGGSFDGSSATLGAQGPWKAPNLPFAFEKAGSVSNGMVIAYHLGSGSDPLEADTDEDGLIDGVEMAHGTNPIKEDTDADGLGDIEEIEVYGTNPLAEDTDGDGLSDQFEIKYGLNPMSASGDDGFDGDFDQDGLSNGEELEYGTSPTLADTDRDGLLDGMEMEIGTNPVQPDTDGDGMSDGWEWKYCRRAKARRLFALGSDPVPDFDPSVDNGSDADPNNDKDADPDGDGLSNGEECENGSDPTKSDTDADGVNDGDEVKQGSDPTDASDLGKPNDRTVVRVYFGDHSGSHSEKYLLEIKPVEGSGPGTTPSGRTMLNLEYGKCEYRKVPLKKGWKYELQLQWSSTKKGKEADYDYTLEIVDRPATVVVDDKSGLLGVDDTSTSFAGADKVVYLYVLGDPLMVFDYDRNGAIEEDDVEKAKENKPFRFWINDDVDKGDICSAPDYCSDMPGQSGNQDDSRVNGRRDLLDFTPVWIDFSGVFPQGTPTRLMNQVEWRLKSPCANAVWTNFSRKDAGGFQRVDRGGCGNNLNRNVYEAETKLLAVHYTTVHKIHEGTSTIKKGSENGAVIPPEFIASAVESGETGVFLIEGCAAGKGLSITCEGKEVSKANLIVSPVENMYRWMNLRPVCGDSSGRESQYESPVNWPDDESDKRNFVFVHGFNVNHDEARSSAAEMFKRLWQSGLRSMFTAVEWYGDIGQFRVPVLGTISFYYYANACNAFATAKHLADECASTNMPGSKVMIAHSLGNVLVSSAAVDHGLAYDKYVMMNAAVAMEAYDPKRRDLDMINTNWFDNGTPYPWRASHWNELFEPEDFRSTLTWRSRFAGIKNVVNCYSTTEDTVGDPNESNILQTVWVIQERAKGSLALDTANVLPGFQITCEGGWGQNARYPIWCSTGDASRLRGLSKDDVICDPPFTPFREYITILSWETSFWRKSERLHSTNLFLKTSAEATPELRARLLCDGIPAESHAMGANPLTTLGPDGNIALMELMRNVDKWPDKFGDDQLRWSHSAFKNNAYFFVYKLYDYLVKGLEK